MRDVKTGKRVRQHHRAKREDQSMARSILIGGASQNPFAEGTRKWRNYERYLRRQVEMRGERYEMPKTTPAPKTWEYEGAGEWA